MKLLSSVAVAAGLLACALSASAQGVAYDSSRVDVNSGNPLVASFTYNNALTQVQFRCSYGSNGVWWYYTRPNTQSQYTAYGPFSMPACQVATTGDTDGDSTLVTSVTVSAPLTAQASNGQTITVNFALFSSEKIGVRYETLSGSSQIVVQ